VKAELVTISTMEEEENTEEEVEELLEEEDVAIQPIDRQPLQQFQSILSRKRWKLFLIQQPWPRKRLLQPREVKWL